MTYRLVNAKLSLLRVFAVVLATLGSLFFSTKIFAMQLEGFETPRLSPGQAVLTPWNANWKFSGSTASGIIRNGGSGWGEPAAPQGSQVAYLQGGNAILSTEVFLPADEYSISFYAARRWFGQEVANPIMVKVNGNPVVARPISPISTEFQKYTTEKFPLTTSSNYIIELSSTIASGDHTTFIDSVTVDSYYKLGVYYYPGWSAAEGKWSLILPYPERQPLLGWYDESQIEIAEKHIDMMADYGIDFVAYDWYWKDGVVAGSHALDAHLRSRNMNRLEFSLLWDVLDAPAKRGTSLTAQDDFRSIVNYWLDHYFFHPKYKKVDGKPMVTIFTPFSFEKNSGDTRSFLRMADDMAKSRGLPGLYFVSTLAGGTTDLLQHWAWFSEANGYSALSAYNLHTGVGAAAQTTSRNYLELDAYYRQNWDWGVTQMNLPYFPPITSGWDMRPWGGSTLPDPNDPSKRIPDPLHDNSVSGPETFENHLAAAKDLIDRHPIKTKKIAMICCFNEFGEGSYIEPTHRYGYSYLEKIRKIFQP